MENHPIFQRIDPLAQWLSQMVQYDQIILIISAGSSVEPKKDKYEGGLMTKKFLIHFLQNSL